MFNLQLFRLGLGCIVFLTSLHLDDINRTTHKFNIYSINEGIIQTQKYVLFPITEYKLFSEENKVPWKLFEARKVAGSATCKQSKTEWNCVVL